MTSLPSGLASISSRLDESPQVRGAVAFGRMVREREDTASVDEAWHGFSTMQDLEIREGDDGATVMRKFRASLAYAKAVAVALGAEDNLTSAIDRHAALVIGSAYRSADRR